MAYRSRVVFLAASTTCPYAPREMCLRISKESMVTGAWVLRAAKPEPGKARPATPDPAQLAPAARPPAPKRIPIPEEVADRPAKPDDATDRWAEGDSDSPKPARRRELRLDWPPAATTSGPQKARSCPIQSDSCSARLYTRSSTAAGTAQGAAGASVWAIACASRHRERDRISSCSASAAILGSTSGGSAP
eukprot:scaffold15258_cov111-Isochrysis_galbana.AAC.7